VTKRAAVVAAGLDPCPMPAHQHLPGRIPQLVGHRRRAAIVLLACLDARESAVSRRTTIVVTSALIVGLSAVVLYVLA
ncbi:hypothetical protein, partial [Bifidobacterium pseudolongum]|uniref:hypothetical protein n=1 Tax=Bifidobacterium pseudolongum TaxID=1694 RepID=UPI001F56BFA6